MKWNCLPFSAISSIDLYDIIALRIQVFVVEQNCPYPELDHKDKKALLVFARDNQGEMAATARILAPGVSYSEVSIGRVCTAASHRREGVGKELMQLVMREIVNHYGNVPVRISAQEYLLAFYASFGFVPVGETYLEDDIPHVEMLYQP